MKKQRKYFTFQEVYDLVLWAKRNEHAAKKPGEAHPTIKAQALLQAGLRDYDDNENHDQFANAYVALFDGAGVRAVAENVYRALYADLKFTRL